jgi:hypothetical protein
MKWLYEELMELIKNIIFLKDDEHKRDLRKYDQTQSLADVKRTL